VKAVLPIDGAGPEELIRLAASVEAHSEHPIARAILEHANRLGVTYAMPKNFKAFPGMGAMAEIDGETALVGKRAIFDGTDYLGRQAEETLDEIGKSAQTAILVGTKTRLYGVLAISDEIRPASARVLAELRRLGVAHTSLLTGDNVVTANVTGREAGFNSVYAELLPQQKAEIVRKLESEYGRTAMVGDGVNDAPALASGSIGIAMGAAGSDSALETADIALMADELERIPWLMRLSRKSRGIIIQNVATSIAVKFVFVALASAGLATLWMAVFADMGISLLVIFNGMRALRSL
jgi:Cd2+/Zn2+-exporting ATPase